MLVTRVNRRTLLISALLALSVMSAAAGPQPSRTVLVLHSYHHGFGWSDAVQQGVEEELARARPKVEAVVEYLDAKRYAVNRLSSTIAELYRQKYADEQPAVIISCDDDALEFLFAYRDEVFPGVPVVFCGLQLEDHDPGLLAGRKGYTGVVERLDMASTIELIPRLQPEVRRIAVIHDRTTSGLADRGLLAEIAAGSAGVPQIVFLDQGEGLSERELLSAVRRLGSRDAVYFVGFSRDRTGKPLEFDELAPRLTAASPVPVYTSAEPYLDHGILGGKVLSGIVHGRSAAGRALRILWGIPAEQLPVTVESSNRYMFDYDALRRFAVPLAALPEQSTVIGEPRSFFDRHPEAVGWGIAAVATLALVSTGMAFLLVLRRRMERRLEESEEKYRNLVQDARAIVLGFDLHGRVTFANDFAQAFFGYSESELVHRRLPGTITRPAPPPHDTLTDAFGDIVHAPHGTSDFESEVVRRNGDRVYVQWANRVVFDADGRPSGFVGVGHDVTARRKAEQELRESEARYRELAENASDVLYVTDEAFRPTYVSPSVYALTGYTTDEFLALPPEQYNDTETFAPIREAMATRLDAEARGERDDTVRLWEHRLIRKDGAVVWVETTTKPMRRSDGSFSGLIGISRDVTRRKRMEQSQIDGERMVRHDVRSPVASIISGLGLLTESSAPDDSRQIVQELQTDARNMLALLDFSRDLAMLEQGDYAIQSQPVDVPKLLVELERELACGYASASCVVTTYNGHPLRACDRLEVPGEPLLVRMLFRSLLKNAVEAPPAGPVCVAISNGPTPRVTIHNRGVVPESVQNRFFEKYATAGKSRGTGLGTYAAKLVADAHKWDIGFSSSKDEGTAVWVAVRLPPARSSSSVVRSTTV